MPMLNQVVVDLVNLDKMFCVTSSGEVFPITNMYDEFGDETAVAADAVSAVAGVDAKWFTFGLGCFYRPKFDA